MVGQNMHREFKIVAQAIKGGPLAGILIGLQSYSQTIQRKFAVIFTAALYYLLRVGADGSMWTSKRIEALG